MGVGRFICVALPFALTVGSMIFLLAGALAGVTDKSLYIFRLNVSNLSISTQNLTSFIENSARGVDLDTRAAISENITAADLGLDNYYDVSLWSYCSISETGHRNCTKAKFNWAASDLNTTYLEDIGSAASYKIELPKTIKHALSIFIKISKWTEVAFIIAFVALALEIVFGIFSNCSSIVSCCTWIISGIASVFVCIAAAMATATAAVVIGAVEASAKVYGVKGSINTRFLVIIWIAAAFALGAGFFWIFTICCCKPEHRSRNVNRGSVGEKLLPTGTYAPLNNSHEMTSGNYYNQNQSAQYGAPRGAPRSDLAYEPYSHRA